MRDWLFKICVLSLPFVVFCGLAWTDICPGGLRVIRLTPGENSPFLDHLLPSDRLLSSLGSVEGELYQTIIKDPLYFSVHLPKTTFETLEIEVAFRSHDQPVLEVGPLMDPFSRTFDLRPLENTALDALPWAQKQVDSTMVYARNADVLDSEVFLKNPPDRSLIATYHADLSAPVRLADYTPLSGTQTVEATLRGDHRFLTYIKNESFFLRADFWDMNRTVGTDSGAIIVRDVSGNVVASKEFGDDGDTRDDQTPRPQEVELSKDGLREGVYSVELKATSDIFWHQFTTKQRYMTFTNGLYLGDEVGYLSATRPVRFVTDAKRMTLETFHGSAVQTVTAGSETVDIAASHQPFDLRVGERGVVAVSVPKGDMQVTGAGKYAFSSEMFFDPEPVRFTDDLDLDARGIDYVVAQYEPPKREGVWSVAKADFVIANIPTSDGSLSFALSAPGIETRGAQVDIHAITVRFKKEPLSLWSKAFWQALRERLPFNL